MLKEELRYGILVRWDPWPGIGDSIDLYENHPGMITDPEWRDVGVRWARRLGHRVSVVVYDYRWLTVIGPDEYERLRREVIRQDEARGYVGTE
ncbi:hypothetical protein CFN78_19360 [Amycolatopsis antarctica]|uniref:Uncharacterized protein n=1 Tax=Amycolatopsis antarctica TaxID=1854586 RepID=A0A263CZS3_9PSEU|nr:hypothetical protein [Amycolatopsis antarctica]OZM71672.1 hypothetical protein CFN78_19360 [Amycolatopsis antarctica]